MTKIRQFIVIILILCLAILLHSCGQMTAEDEGLDSKSIEEASGSTGITTDDTTTDNSTESVKFVAVGNDGIILTSPEGTTWTSRTSGTSSGFLGVKYLNNYFWAVNSASIFKSSDGISWTSSSFSGASGDNLENLAYGNSIYVVISNMRSRIYTSSDLTSGTNRQTCSGSL